MNPWVYSNSHMQCAAPNKKLTNPGALNSRYQINNRLLIGRLTLRHVQILIRWSQPYLKVLAVCCPCAPTQLWFVLIVQNSTNNKTEIVQNKLFLCGSVFRLYKSCDVRLRFDSQYRQSSPVSAFSSPNLWTGQVVIRRLIYQIATHCSNLFQHR